MNLILKLLQSLTADTASAAAPFALGEIPALLAFASAFGQASFDLLTGKISAEDYADLRKDAVDTLKGFIAVCEAEGIKLLTDMPGILFSAGGDMLLAEFGFNKTTAAIAATPLP